MAERGILTTAQKAEKIKKSILSKLALDVKNNLQNTLDLDGRGKKVEFNDCLIAIFLECLAEWKQSIENPNDRMSGDTHYQQTLTFEVMEDFLSGKKVDKIKLIEALDFIKFNMVVSKLMRKFLDQIKEHFC